MPYLWVTLSKNANRQTDGEGRERTEENNDRGLAEEEGLWSCSLCCSAKEMHSHALFSNACLGVVHKRAWLTEEFWIRRRGGLASPTPSRCAYTLQPRATKLYSKFMP